MLVSAAAQVTASTSRQPSALTRAADDPKTRATWRQLGFQLTSQEKLDELGVTHMDLLHMDNTVQVKSWGPAAHQGSGTRAPAGTQRFRRSWHCPPAPTAGPFMLPSFHSQMHKEVPSARPWKSLMLRHEAFQQRVYYIPDLLCVFPFRGKGLGGAQVVMRCAAPWQCAVPLSCARLLGTRMERRGGG